MPCLHEHWWTRTIYPSHQKRRENECLAQELQLLLLAMLIIEFYRYVIYRTYHALIHYGWPKEDVFSHLYLGRIPTICPFLNLESLYFILVFFTVGTISETNLLASIIICCLISVPFMFKVMPTDTTDDTEEFYKELNSKYENEKHRIIKGFLVALFVILSWVVFFFIFWVVLSR